jgi:hypothetical protein
LQRSNETQQQDLFGFEVEKEMQMKRLLGALFAVTLLAGTTHATLFNDAVGDLNDGTSGGADFSSFTHLDIVSLEVANDATDLSFTLTLNGDIAATDWGKYMIGIDSTSSSPGDAASNGWGRPINMPSGMDYWVGSWVDSGGGHQVWDYNDSNPGNWTEQPPAPTARPVDLSSAAAGQVSFSIPLADLGLSVGDMIFLDAYASGGGGGDGAVDALSDPNPSILDWGDSFSSPDRTGLSKYTIVIPEPAGIALLSLGALFFWRNRRRR